MLGAGGEASPANPSDGRRAEEASPFGSPDNSSAARYLCLSPHILSYCVFARLA